MTALDSVFRDFGRFGVGFDDLFHRVENLHSGQNKYPPYNIVKSDDNKYVIEIAVAGFSKDELSAEMKEGTLTITGNKESKDDDMIYLHQGISARAFTRSFVLDDQVKVVDADMHNGMLKVYLERIVPEEAKPRKIEINTSEPKLLTEEG